VDQALVPQLLLLGTQEVLEIRQQQFHRKEAVVETTILRRLTPAAAVVALGQSGLMALDHSPEQVERVNPQLYQGIL
jgi:hypothetical protein